MNNRFLSYDKNFYERTNFRSIKYRKRNWRDRGPQNCRRTLSQGTAVIIYIFCKGLLKFNLHVQLKRLDRVRQMTSWQYCKKVADDSKMCDNHSKSNSPKDSYVFRNILGRFVPYPEEVETDCSSLIQCPSDKECRNGKCIGLTKLLNTVCVDDSDCEIGTVCQAGLCGSSDCSDGADCDTLEICDSGKCIKPVFTGIIGRLSALG